MGVLAFFDKKREQNKLNISFLKFLFNSNIPQADDSFLTPLALNEKTLPYISAFLKRYNGKVGESVSPKDDQDCDIMISLSKTGFLTRVSVGVFAVDLFKFTPKKTLIVNDDIALILRTNRHHLKDNYAVHSPEMKRLNQEIENLFSETSFFKRLININKEHHDFIHILDVFGILEIKDGTVHQGVNFERFTSKD